MEVPKVGGFLADVDGLEDAAITVDHLTDWVRDFDVHEVFKIVTGFARVPFFWRDHLQKVVLMYTEEEVYSPIFFLQ